MLPLGHSNHSNIFITVHFIVEMCCADDVQSAVVDDVELWHVSVFSSLSCHKWCCFRGHWVACLIMDLLMCFLISNTQRLDSVCHCSTLNSSIYEDLYWIIKLQRKAITDCCLNILWWTNVCTVYSGVTFYGMFASIPVSTLCGTVVQRIERSTGRGSLHFDWAKYHYIVVMVWSLLTGLLSIFSKSIADIRYRYRLKKYRRYRYRYFAVKVSISRSILRYRYFYSDHTVATSVDGREPRDYGVRKHCRVASYM